MFEVLLLAVVLASVILWSNGIFYVCALELSDALYKIGQVELAARLQRRANQLLRYDLFVWRLVKAKIFDHCAEWWLDAGFLAEADRSYKRAWLLGRGRFTPRRSVRLLNEWSCLLLELGFKNRAEKRLLEAMIMVDSVIDDEKRAEWEVGIAQNLACLYQENKSWEAAAGLLTLAHDRLQDHYGASHPFMGRIKARRANVMMDMGKMEAAENDLIDALKILGAHRQDFEADYANVLNNMACFYDQAGKYDTAETLYREAIFIEEMSPDTDPQDLVASLENYCLMLWNTERPDEARDIARRALYVRRTYMPNTLDENNEERGAA